MFICQEFMKKTVNIQDSNLPWAVPSGFPRYSINHWSQVLPTRDNFLDSSPVPSVIHSPITLLCHLLYLIIIHYLTFSTYYICPNGKARKIGVSCKRHFDMSLCCIFSWDLLGTKLNYQKIKIHNLTLSGLSSCVLCWQRARTHFRETFHCVAGSLAISHGIVLSHTFYFHN